MTTGWRPRLNSDGSRLSFTMPPEPDGWEVTYDLDIADGDPILIGIHVTSTTPARDGLTAERARKLIRPGDAMSKIRQSGPLGPTAIPSANRREMSADMYDYVSWQTWLNNLPKLRVFAKSRPLATLTRRERIAQTAALYVQAMAAGDRAPRQRVANEQGRAEAAVRDDLHAARRETPPLLLGGGPGKSGGRLTDEGRALVDQMRAAAKPRRKGGKR
jgi:hypothetical protein